MNVGQLKQQLSKYPDNMDVFLGERMSEFTFGLLNTVQSADISFDPENGEEPAIVECVILTED